MEQRNTTHVARHTSHITHHASHITHHTSHITHHTSHITRHTCPHILAQQALEVFRRLQLLHRLVPMLHCSGGGVVALSFRGGGTRGRAGGGGRLFGFVAAAHGGVGGMYRLHVNVGGSNSFQGGGDGGDPGEEGGGKPAELALAQAETCSAAEWRIGNWKHSGAFGRKFSCTCARYF